MKPLPGHKLAGQSKDHYEIEGPDGVRFKVAKHLLDLGGHVAIGALPKATAMAEGGAVTPNAPSQPTIDDPDFEPGQQPVPTTGTNDRPAQHFVEGGTALNLPDTPTDSVALPPAEGVGPPTPWGTQPSAPGTVAPVIPNPPTMTAQGSVDTSALPDQSSAAASQAAPQPQQAAPPTEPGVPPPLPGQSISDYLKAHDQAISAQQTANTARATAEGQMGTDVAAAYNKQADDMAKIVQDTQAKNDAFNQTTSQLRDDIGSGKIDPNHFISNMSTGGKIVAVIAAALGGGGAALAGQPNLAIKVMQDNIDRDIAAQKENLDTKKGLLRSNLEQQHDMNAAVALTKSQMIAATQGQVNAAAARNGGAIAHANAAALNAQLEAERQKYNIEAAQASAIWNYKQGALQSGLPGGQAGNGPDGFDYQKFNTLYQLGSPEEKKNLLEERTKWEQANKEQTDIKDAFGRIRGASDMLTNLGPDALDLRNSTTQVHALADSTLAKYARDNEGRVTPVSMEANRHLIPKGSFKENEATFNTKLNQMLDVAKQGYNFPSLESNGIIRPLRTSAQVRQGNQ